MAETRSPKILQKRSHATSMAVSKQFEQGFRLSFEPLNATIFFASHPPFPP
jgi:hypothetical protein